MPYKDKAMKYARRRERMSAGLCRDCPNQVVVGQLCSACHEKKIAQNLAYRPSTGSSRGRRPLNPAVEFWRFVDKDGPIPRWRIDLGNCWQWKGGGSKYGSYNRVESRVAGTSAHRVAFWLENGRVPKVVDHLCENRMCVRPSHLDEVDSWRENNRRSQPQYREQLLRVLGLSGTS